MTVLRFALLGHPVAHSISPAIHAAVYGALGLPHRYELRDCPAAGAVRTAVEALRAGELGGLNVTVPWKRLALELADRADASATEVGACNVLWRDPTGSVVASNTDVVALVQELERLAPACSRATVLGAGGAALAAVAACARRGITEVGVTARRFTAAAPEARWPLAGQFRGLGARLFAWQDSGSAGGQLADWAAGSDLLIQASSAGMLGAEPGEAVAAALPWERVSRSAIAYDVVYNPDVTPFLAAARRRGIRAEGGLGMLVLQAALAEELWLGQRVALGPLREAAARALAASGGADR